jgi:pantothenate kinase type III
MADPFSATGSVVGIVSLGITLCSGIISYIDDFKSAKNKAEQITSEVEHLSDVLELLENIVGKASASSTVSVTRAGVVACATAIGQIRDRLEKYNRSKQPGIRACLRNIKDRLCLPFKQADVFYWKNVLRDVQQSLHTALIALQM